MMTTRAVFLDRDGVINRAIMRDGKPHPPETIDSLEVLAGVPEALLRLRDAGFRLIVVTNQPDVARGAQTRETVEAMHARLTSDLPIDEIVTCYHDGDGCDCRKPKPGAILDAARRHGVDLDHSFMVGDRWRDIEAGQRAGCRCLFVDNNYREPQPAGTYVRVRSMADAAEWILSGGERTSGPQSAGLRPGDPAAAPKSTDETSADCGPEARSPS